LDRGEHHTRLVGWNGERLDLVGDGTHFGYVFDGAVRIELGSALLELGAGMYFAIPEAATLQPTGSGVVLTRVGYHGVFMAGGPIEARGRLCYIDGCTDSLLVPPVLLGDPCLNALYFPAGIEQTRHTHPSLRAGLVARGAGVCEAAGQRFDLTPGLAFHIPAETPHRFLTASSPMVVVAYHPDSDFGPTHEVHPMINRTIVEGVPASRIPEIRTPCKKPL
jgi:hypothetical protein